MLRTNGEHVPSSDDGNDSGKDEEGRQEDDTAEGGRMAEGPSDVSDGSSRV